MNWKPSTTAGRRADQSDEESAEGTPKDNQTNPQRNATEAERKVQNGATASGQETENVSETSSAKQRREKGLKKFDIEFKTKMRLEQARHERRIGRS